MVGQFCVPHNSERKKFEVLEVKSHVLTVNTVNEHHGAEKSGRSKELKPEKRPKPSANSRQN